MTLRHRPAALGGLTCALVLGAGWSTAAHADRASDAPVTAPDRVTVAGRSAGIADVLANDSDPQGDVLHVCRVDVPDGAPLEVEVERELYVGEGGEEDPFGEDGSDFRDGLSLQSTANRAGTYSVTYYACDDAFLTPGTLTVTVDRVEPLQARAVPGKRKVVRFTNPSNRKFSVVYGTSFRESPLGRVGVPRQESRNVRLPSSRLVFVAFQPRTGFFQTGRLRLDEAGRVVVQRDQVSAPAARRWVG